MTKRDKLPEITLIDPTAGVANPAGAAHIQYLGVAFRVPRADVIYHALGGGDVDAAAARQATHERGLDDLPEVVTLPNGEEWTRLPVGHERIESIDPLTQDLLVTLRAAYKRSR